jgi:hypothetical protein
MDVSSAVGSTVAVAGAGVGVGGWRVGEGGAGVRLGAVVALGAGRMVAVALASCWTCTPPSDPWLEEPEQAARRRAARAAKIKQALKAQETLEGWRRCMSRS